MPNYNDNARPYGSRKVSFKRVATGGGPGAATTWSALANATNVILENISVNRPTRQVNVYDEVGKPTDSFAVDDFVTGSATAQIAKDSGSVTTAALQPGDAFSTTFDASIGQENFIVTSADQPFAQLDYFKQSIQYKKLYVAVP
jgi:hypothetical protein